MAADKETPEIRDLKKRIIEELKSLRINKGFKSEARFSEKTGLAPKTIKDTESGATFPTIGNIKRWVNGCGVSLSEFFAALEGQPEQVEILLSEREFYKYLTTILKYGDDFWKTGIKANLRAMAVAATTEPLTEDQQKGHGKEKKINLIPNERFRGKQRSR